jgi:hypothetical protein
LVIGLAASFWAVVRFAGLARDGDRLRDHRDRNAIDVCGLP